MPNVADDVRNNKPASLCEMSVLASLNKVNLKVVNNNNYKRTPDELKNNVEIINVEKGKNDDKIIDGIGHAY